MKFFAKLGIIFACLSQCFLAYADVGQTYEHIAKQLCNMMDMDCATSLKLDMAGVEILKKASSKGDSNATSALGACYYLGVGVAVDKNKASENFAKSAFSGNVYGMWGLGVCMLDSLNEKTAFSFFKKASKNLQTP